MSLTGTTTATPALGRKRRPRYITNDKTLLHIFLAAAVLVACSILLVPLNIENESVLNYHGVAKLTSTQTTSTAMAPLAVVDTDTTTDENNNNDDATMIPPKVPYHVVFSTGCSTFQDWQSYVFFYHVLKSGQEGHITRIASGCQGQDAIDLERIFQEQIAVMAPGRIHLHMTPDFGNAKPGIRNFKYFNKPMGMRHWMQHGLGYPDKHLQHDNTVIILMDPDQILLRPFTNDFTNSSEKWRLSEGYKLRVEHGSPFSQQYGYGLQWLTKVKPEHTFDGQPTPVTNMTRHEAFDYYMAMGPPYVATGKDMYAIVSKWAEIVPRVHDDYPHLLAEMFAYNLASAHLGLRHTVAHSFMVSDVAAGGEGWGLIDAIPAKDICSNFPKSEYPHVIHYCQRYFLGKWFIGKYRLRKDFISCEAPLLTVPPDDLAVKYTSAITPSNERKELKPKQAKEEAFMVCVMINALNDAAVYYKDHHCDKATANYDYTYTFADDMEMPEDKIAK